MPSYAGPSASRSGDIADTLRLLAYLALAVVLIVLDHRGGWLSLARQQAQVHRRDGTGGLAIADEVPAHGQRLQRLHQRLAAGAVINDVGPRPLRDLHHGFQEVVPARDDRKIAAVVPRQARLVLA